MGAQLEKESARLRERSEKLDGCIQSLFEGVAMHRYRDSNEELRATCAAAIGSCIAKLPETFLKESYLKYLGWMVSDTSSVVRATAVGKLVGVYKACGFESEALSHFTARFEGRFVEMICDTDKGVAIEAIKLVTHLKGAGALTMQDKAIGLMMHLMKHETHPVLWRALAAFLQLRPR